MMDLIHFLDKITFEWILIWRYGWLENVFLVITMLGKSYVVALAAIIFAFYLWREKQIKYIILLFTITGGSTVSTYLLKHFIARPRPADFAVYLEDLFSFPSGHATIAVALYGFLGYVLYKKTIGRQRWLAVLGVFLLVLIIGFSRIYLGVHYLSDVIGGYLVGGVWLGGGILFLEKFKQTKSSTTP